MDESGKKVPRMEAPGGPHAPGDPHAVGPLFWNYNPDGTRKKKSGDPDPEASSPDWD